jgi:hypothetical protein
MCGERVDDVAPDLLFQSIKACRRLRAALSRYKGHD